MTCLGNSFERVIAIRFSSVIVNNLDVLRTGRLIHMPSIKQLVRIERKSDLAPNVLLVDQLGP